MAILKGDPNEIIYGVSNSGNSNLLSVVKIVCNSLGYYRYCISVQFWKAKDSIEFDKMLFHHFEVSSTIFYDKSSLSFCSADYFNICYNLALKHFNT
jgi:hypothetical protein